MKNMDRNERHEPAAEGVGGPACNRPAGWDDIREATFNSGETGQGGIKKGLSPGAGFGFRF